jgi:hypothetical protein
MAWYLNNYRCDECDVDWEDEWSCMCNDRCPTCDYEIEPYDSDDLSLLVEQSPASGNWVVCVSPDSAEHDPAYRKTAFATKREALDYAEAVKAEHVQP